MVHSAVSVGMKEISGRHGESPWMSGTAENLVREESMSAFPHSVGSTHSMAIGPPFLLARRCFRYWTETVPQGQTGHVPWLMSPSTLESSPSAHMDGVHLSDRPVL